jgi:DNA mismatch repair protein MutS2
VDRAKKTARVSLSGMEIDVPLHKIEIIEEQSADVASQYPSIKYPTKPDVPHTLDLHGLRVAEALERIDKYLDDAVLADYSSVKLVHGYGTGMLRQGIHEFLKHHYHVKAFRIGITEEGGDAVTIVDLK